MKRLIILLLLFALITPFAIKKGKKFFLKRELRKITSLTLEGEEGYTDVDRWIKIRKDLKPTLSKNTWREKHVRLAEVDLMRGEFSEKFYEKLASPPVWMVAAAEGAMYPFLKISIDLPSQEHLPLAKYRVQDGKLYVKDLSGKHISLKYMNGALNRLAKAGLLPDVDFLLSFEDVLDEMSPLAPIFVFSKREDNPYMIPIPDHEYISGYDTLDSQIDKASEFSPWDEKVDQVFWRGATTGGDFAAPTWRSLPRARLVAISKAYPDEVDAKFTILVQGAEKREELRHSLGTFVSPEESVKYRYLIDIDGNGSTFSRFYWILRSNSVALKQSSPYVQWYYPALKPYVHYIPVARDLSNLEERLSWARHHSHQAAAIALAGKRLIQEELQTEDAYLYLTLLFREYGKLFDLNGE